MQMIAAAYSIYTLMLRGFVFVCSISVSVCFLIRSKISLFII